MKKFIAGFIAGAMLFGVLGVFAAVGLRDVRIADTVSLWVHGRRVETDIIHAVRYDNPYGFGRNYVSARDLAEALGYFVDWCGDTNRILVTSAPSATEAQATHALVGTWAWDYDDTWRYIFNPDGTGVRWFAGEMEEFTWRVPRAGYLFIYPQNTGWYESWSYTIRMNGTRLTVDTRWGELVTHNYTRMSDQAVFLSTPQSPPAHGLSEFYPENSIVPRLGYLLGRPHIDMHVWESGVVHYVYTTNTARNSIDDAVVAAFITTVIVDEAGFEFTNITEGYAENSHMIYFQRYDTLLTIGIFVDETHVLFYPQ